MTSTKATKNTKSKNVKNEKEQETVSNKILTTEVETVELVEAVGQGQLVDGPVAVTKKREKKVAVVEAVVVEAVAVEAVAAEAVKAPKKRAKKSAAVAAVAVEAVAVEAVAVEAVAVEAVKAPKKRAKKSAAVEVAPVEVAPVEVAPVEVAPVEAVTVEAVKALTKRAKKATTVKEAADETVREKKVARPVKATKTKRTQKKASTVDVGTVEQGTVEPGTVEQGTATSIKKRNFKCIVINSEGVVECTGRYSGRKPKQAGNKACTRIFKNFYDIEQTVPEKVIFGMHECTRGSKHKKKYFYIGTREKLETPLHIKINKIDPATNGNMVISYNYNYFVKKLIDTECSEYKLLYGYDNVVAQVNEIVEEVIVHTESAQTNPKIANDATTDTAPVVIEEGHVKVTKKSSTAKTDKPAKRTVNKSS